MNLEEALFHAERFFLKTFLVSFSEKERSDLKVKLSLGKPSGMLAIWIGSVNEAVSERKRSNKTGEESTWRRIFRQCEYLMAQNYQRLKLELKEPKKKKNYWGSTRVKDGGRER